MSDATPSRPSADRNLLFGILALQMDFITRDALITAMNAWVLDKAKPLGQILVEQGALQPAKRDLLEPLVAAHLEMHNGDAEKSLAALAVPAPLRQELHSLGDGDVKASLARIPTPSGISDSWATRPTSAEQPNATGLRYHVLRPHGKGGLGEVFVALDQELNRQVALKEICDEHADDPQSRGRFVREAEITGGLEHPGIVPVYGLGQYGDGRPYYAMRFVQGETLKDAIARYHKQVDSHQRADAARSPELELRALLTRFVAVCNAIAYAHSRGVIHRDIKPSNIMLGKYGETLVVDWGLAKALPDSPAGSTSKGADEPMLVRRSVAGIRETHMGAALGTPAYMSPEQAVGRIDQLGPASDIYSLGATLYTLLTGRPAIDSKELAEVLSKTQRGDWPPPRQVKGDVSPALDAICRKAMALRPADRYVTALELAAEVERWLADQPVSAWPEPWPVRGRRWARQHKVLVGWASAVGAVAATVVVAVLLVADSQARGRQEQVLRQSAETERNRAEGNEAEAASQRERAEQNQAEAEKQRGLAVRYLYGSRMDLAHREWQAARIGRVLELLEESCPQESGQEDLRSFEWHYLRRLCHSELLTLRGHTHQVTGLAFSPDGKRLATSSADNTLKLWDLATGLELLTFAGHTGPVGGVAFSPDGKVLASGSSDHTVILWDSKSGREMLTLRGHGSDVVSVAFSPDGKRLASGSSDRTVKLWDAATGQDLRTFTGHTAAVGGVAFSPDGKRLASGGWDQTVRLWDTETGQTMLTLKGHASTTLGVAFSPDGKRLASGSVDHTVKLWDTATGQGLQTLKGHGGAVYEVAFGPDGNQLASGSEDQMVKLWDCDTGQETLTLRGHTSTVITVAFSPDGKRLASGSVDRTGKLWDIAASQDSLTLKGHTGRVLAVAFSPDSKRLASGSEDQNVKVWDAATGQNLLTLKGHTGAVFSVAFSPDGKRLGSGGGDQTVKLWDGVTGNEVSTLKGHAGAVSSVAFSPDGNRLASASYDGTVKLWDTRTGRELLTLKGHTGQVRSVVFSPDGKRLATGSPDRMVKLWDSATGHEVLTLKGHSFGVLSVAFSPDGKRVASASGDKTGRLWEAGSGQEILTLKGHANMMLSLAFSPDGKRLASSSHDQTVKLWDTVTGQEVFTFKGHAISGSSLAFSPDGQRLASAGLDQTVKVWEAAPVPEALMR
jgi:WD40 repeat protein/serine/threonine protein kinase